MFGDELAPELVEPAFEPDQNRSLAAALIGISAPGATIEAVTSTDPMPAGADPEAAQPTVLTDVWQGDDSAGFDAERSNVKICRNARHFTFDGFAEGDEDIATSWRKLLEREGKASPDGTSVRDLVLDPTSGD